MTIKDNIKLIVRKLCTQVKNAVNIMKNWKRFWIVFSALILLILILLYEWWVSGKFQESHVFLMGLIYVLAILFIFVKKFRVWWLSLINFLGLEKIGIANFYMGFYGGILISIYLLLSGDDNLIPPVLQFSIIPVTAMLGGLVISGANYSKIKPEKRTELLRVAQNLIVATIAFIFFAAMFFLSSVGGNVDPNHFPIDTKEWTKAIIYWLAVFLFFSGTTLFVIGIINLARSLKNLKNE